MHRRDLLIGLSTSAVVGLAGCTGDSVGTGGRDLDTEEIKGNAEEIPYNDLMRNADQYEGSAIHIPQGKIAQSLGDEDEGFQFRVYVTPGEFAWEDDVLVRWDGERFLTDDIIEVWGVSNGLVTYEAVLGNERTIPDITAVDIGLMEEG